MKTKDRPHAQIGDTVRFVHLGWWAVGTILGYDESYEWPVLAIRFDYTSINTKEGEVHSVNRLLRSFRPMTKKSMEDHQRRMKQYKEKKGYW